MSEISISLRDVIDAPLRAKVPVRSMAGHLLAAVAGLLLGTLGGLLAALLAGLIVVGC